MTYYHGGKGGMKNGMFILPALTTKAQSTAAFGNHLCDPSQVYVTTDYTGAMMYAAAVNGDVYEVTPVGPLLDDPDCSLPGLSYSCSRARIVKRHKVSAADKAAVIRVLGAA